MNKVDQKFVDFLKTRMPSDEIEQSWLENAIEDYLSFQACATCNGTDLKIIIDTKVILKCNYCSQTTEGISIDKIKPIDYNAVTFLHEDKILDILDAQGVRLDG